MPFKIALSPSYRVKVAVETPKETGGFEKSEFFAVFKRVETDELEKLRKMDDSKEVVRTVLVGWADLLDEDGVQVPYTETNRDMLLLIPQALLAVTEAFWKSIFKAREKN